MKYSVYTYLAPKKGISMCSISTQNRFKMLPKSLWVWTTKKTRLLDMSFFALKYGFNPIYISLPAGANLYEKKIEINKMKEAGQTIYLAGGSPQWIYQRDGYEQFENFIGQAKLIRASGIALDIEPQTITAWNTKERNMIANQYYELMKKISNVAGFQQMPIVATVIPEYKNITTNNGSTLIESIGETVQFLVLMAYQKSISDVNHRTQQSIIQLERKHTPFWFGINVCEQNEPDRKIIESSLTINTLFRNTKGFMGIAYNDYDSIKKILD